MKYNIGYYGTNEIMKKQLTEYVNARNNSKINYLDIRNMDNDLVEATSFNAIIYDTSMHKSEKDNDNITDIITSNPDIDIMPIICADDNTSVLSEIENEVELMKNLAGVSTIPYLISSDREAKLFMNTIFSALSSKSIRNMEKIERYKVGEKGNLLKVLKKIVITLELKDPYTRDHSRRVAKYAGQIASKMGLSSEEISQISEAGWLHDIGKLAINDSVLMKPGKLDDTEFAHMRSHAALGSVLLNNIFEGNEFEHIKDLTKHHHERYDGNGYPDKIKGEDIPLGARILCLADSFDAMTTKRSYNSPKKIEDAILDLQKNSGTQFDPKVVSVFIELLKQSPEKLKETLDISIDENGYIDVFKSKPSKSNEHINKTSQDKTI